MSEEHRKPPSLRYGREDAIPMSIGILLGGQHAVVSLMTAAYVVVFAKEIGLTTAAAAQVLSMTILAMALATAIQAGSARIGSGHLILHQPSPIILPAAIQAGIVGGLGLVATMTVLTGVIVVLVARAMRHLRKFFPADVSGVVVLMLGLSILEPTIRRMLVIEGTGYAFTFDLRGLFVGVLTLAIVVGVSIWSKRLKLFALLIGVPAGYLASLATGVVDADHFAALWQAPLVDVPAVAMPDLAFDLSLAPVFALIAVVKAVDGLGVSITADKMNDAEWRRPNLSLAARAIQTDGLGIVAGGLAGGYCLGFSSSSLGLCFATGVTARRVAVIAAAFLAAVAFLPKLTIVIALMPDPVVGAVLAYAASFLIASGMDLILSRLLSERRIFMVGFSITIGLSTVLFPELYDPMPNPVHAIFTSPLITGTVVAIVLNLIFQIGIGERAQTTVDTAGDVHGQVRDFLEEQGKAWSARRDVVARATLAANECIDAILGNGLADDAPAVVASFDEYNLAVEIRYHGQPLELAERPPTAEEVIEDEAAAARLAGFLARRYADKAQVTVGREGEIVLRVVLEH